MNRRPLLQSSIKRISLLLSGLVVTSSFLPSLAEANFWKERQSALKAFGATPIVRPVLRTSVVLGNSVDSKMTTSSLLPTHGVRIKEVFPAGSQSLPRVILLQDVHANLEAQSNLAKTIEELTRQHSTPERPLFVGVEGVFGAFDFSRFRAFPDKRLTKDVAEHFLTENKIAAASYVGLTTDAPLPEFYGVDDPESYRLNVAAYRVSAPHIDALKKEWEKRGQQLAHEKRAVYNPQLAALDAAQADYRAGRSALAEYLNRLWKEPPPSPPTVRRGGEIHSFIQAARLESSIDFDVVEHERRRVLEKLARVISKQEADELMALSKSFGAGSLSHSDYYGALEGLLKRHSFFLRETPAFDAYIRYVLLADRINADQLLSELERLEEETLARLAVTPEEKKLAEESERHHLTGKLLDFALTPREWERYREFTSRHPGESRGPGLEHVSKGRLKDWIPAFAGMTTQPFEDFYRLADIRSRKMVDNLLSRVLGNSKSGSSTKYQVPSTAVLVAGGFHTDLITQELKTRGISYAVLTPQLTRVDTVRGSEYLSVFTREKTPLEKLLQGDRLFLANAETLAGHPAARVVNTQILASLSLRDPKAALQIVFGGILASFKMNGGVSSEKRVDFSLRSAAQWIIGMGVLASFGATGTHPWVESYPFFLPYGLLFLAGAAAYIFFQWARIEFGGTHTVSTAQKYYEDAVHHSDYTEEEKRQLLSEEPQVTRYFFLVGWKIYLGWRAKYVSLLTGKGGTRFAVDLRPQTIKTLAREMLYKVSVMNLPFTGAKSGARVNFQKLSDEKKAQFARRLGDEAFSSATSSLYDPLGYSGAPDIGTDATVMNRITDQFIFRMASVQNIHDLRTNKLPEEFAKLLKEKPDPTKNPTETAYLDTYVSLWNRGEVDGSLLGLVTGKDVVHGGIHGREAATGKGVCFSAQAVARKYGDLWGWKEGLKGRRVAILGLGNVGYFTAKSFEEEGAQVIAVGEYNSFVYDETGLDISRLKEHFKEKKSFTGYSHKGAQSASGESSGTEALFVSNAEIVIPAAKEDQITMGNVERFSKERMPHLRMIVEAANGPMTPAAAAWLAEHRPDVVIVPDIFANAGGVTVSAFEWINNRQSKLREELAKGKSYGTAESFIREVLDWLESTYTPMVKRREPSEKIIVAVHDFLKSYMDQRADKMFEMADLLKTTRDFSHEPLREAAYKMAVDRRVLEIRRAQGLKAGPEKKEDPKEKNLGLAMSWWAGPKNWPSVRRVWMPVLEEALRLAAFGLFGIIGVIVYTFVHAAGHYHVDVHAARGDHLTPWQFWLGRFWIRLFISFFAFTTPYLLIDQPTAAQTILTLQAFGRALFLHILNNTLIYDFFTKKLKWKWWMMSAADPHPKLDFIEKNAIEALRRVPVLREEFGIQFYSLIHSVREDPHHQKSDFRRALEPYIDTGYLTPDQADALVDQFDFPDPIHPERVERHDSPIANSGSPTLLPFENFSIPLALKRAGIWTMGYLEGFKVLMDQLHGKPGLGQVAFRAVLATHVEKNFITNEQADLLADQFVFDSSAEADKPLSRWDGVYFVSNLFDQMPSVEGLIKYDMKRGGAEGLITFAPRIMTVKKFMDDMKNFREGNLAWPSQITRRDKQKIIDLANLFDPDQEQKYWLVELLHPRNRLALLAYATYVNLSDSSGPTKGQVIVRGSLSSGEVMHGVVCDLYSTLGLKAFSKKKIDDAKFFMQQAYYHLAQTVRIHAEHQVVPALHMLKQERPKRAVLVKDDLFFSFSAEALRNQHFRVISFELPQSLPPYMDVLSKNYQDPFIQDLNIIAMQLFFNLILDGYKKRFPQQVNIDLRRSKITPETAWGVLTDLVKNENFDPINDIQTFLKETDTFFSSESPAPQPIMEILIEGTSRVHGSPDPVVLIQGVIYGRKFLRDFWPGKLREFSERIARLNKNGVFCSVRSLRIDDSPEGLEAANKLLENDDLFYNYLNIPEIRLDYTRNSETLAEYNASALRDTGIGFDFHSMSWEDHMALYWARLQEENSIDLFWHDIHFTPADFYEFMDDFVQLKASVVANELDIALAQVGRAAQPGTIVISDMGSHETLFKRLKDLGFSPRPTDWTDESEEHGDSLHKLWGVMKIVFLEALGEPIGREEKEKSYREGFIGNLYMNFIPGLETGPDLVRVILRDIIDQWTVADFEEIFRLRHAWIENQFDEDEENYEYLEKVAEYLLERARLYSNPSDYNTILNLYESDEDDPDAGEAEWGGPQSLTGTFGGPWVYGVLMPVLEEAGRWAAYHYAGSTVSGILCAVLLYSIVHALLHVFVDVYENGFKGHIRRLPGRFVLSMGFGISFLVGAGAAPLLNLLIGSQIDPELLGLIFASAAHMFNNLWLRHHMPESMRWLAQLMSVIPADDHDQSWQDFFAENWGLPLDGDIRNAQEFAANVKRTGVIDGQKFVSQIKTDDPDEYPSKVQEQAMLIRALFYIEPDLAASLFFSFHTNHGAWATMMNPEWPRTIHGGIEADLIAAIIKLGLESNYSSSNNRVRGNMSVQMTYSIQGIGRLPAYLPAHYFRSIIENLPGRTSAAYLSIVRDYLSSENTQALLQETISIDPPSIAELTRAERSIYRAMQGSNTGEISDGVVLGLDELGETFAERAGTVRAMAMGPEQEVAGALLAGVSQNYVRAWYDLFFDGNELRIEKQVLAGMIICALAVLDGSLEPHWQGNIVRVSKDITGLIELLKSLPDHICSQILAEVKDSRLNRRLMEVSGPIGHIRYGERMGYLRVIESDIPTLEDLQAIDRGSIVAMTTLPTSDVNVGPFEGIITFFGLEGGNHAMERANEWDAPCASLPADMVMKLKDKFVVFEVVDEERVILREATEADKRRYQPPTTVPETITLPVVDLSRNLNYIRTNERKMREISMVGPKIAHLNWLAAKVNFACSIMGRFVGWLFRMPKFPFGLFQSDVRLAVAGGSALPFDAFWRVLALNGKKNEFEALTQKLNQSNRNEAIDILDEIKKLVSELRFYFPNDPFWNEKNLSKHFGELWENGVFIRDATNAQNLLGYPWFGAGLYLTEQHVVGKNEFWDSVRRVWMDVWDQRPFAQRRRHKVDETTIHPAIWLSPSRPVDYSFVMHTSNTLMQDRDHLSLFVAQGYGTAIVSDAVEFRGKSTSVIVNKSSGKILEEETQPSTKKMKAALRQMGGLEVVTAPEYNDFVYHDRFEELVDWLTKVGIWAEEITELPQKIEGTIYFDAPKKQWVITLDQCDPFVRATEVKGTDATYLVKSLPYYLALVWNALVDGDYLRGRWFGRIEKPEKLIIPGALAEAAGAFVLIISMDQGFSWVVAGYALLHALAWMTAQLLARGQPGAYNMSVASVAGSALARFAVHFVVFLLYIPAYYYIHQPNSFVYFLNMFFVGATLHLLFDALFPSLIKRNAAPAAVGYQAQKFSVDELLGSIQTQDRPLGLETYSFENVLKEEKPTRVVVVPAGKSATEIIEEIKRVVEYVNDENLETVADICVLLTGKRENFWDADARRILGFVSESSLQSEFDVESHLLDGGTEGRTLVMLPDGTDITEQTLEHLKSLSEKRDVRICLIDRIAAGMQAVVGRVKDILQRLRIIRGQV
ncbi:MAG: hypothetical protein KCHDKBKB_00876 [Elusimicrobia bacterium]|nr:hypothetical protein [Elusimicrobiota bacterium]